MRDFRTVNERLSSAVKCWRHELLELQARQQHGSHSPEQRQILRQRIIEMESRLSRIERLVKAT